MKVCVSTEITNVDLCNTPSLATIVFRQRRANLRTSNPRGKSKPGFEAETFLRS